MSAKFVFITGPMFCGKTEELIRISERYILANKRIILAKPKADNRYGKGVICTHRNHAVPAIEIKSLEDLFPVISNNHDDIDAIFVDEIQFVEGVDIRTIRTLVETLGISLYVSGLTLDSFRKPFEVAKEILPYAEVVQLSSVCSFCGVFDAKYTYRVNTDSQEQVLVGGSDLYKAICLNCLLEKEEMWNAEETT